MSDKTLMERIDEWHKLDWHYYEWGALEKAEELLEDCREHIKIDQIIIEEMFTKEEIRAVLTDAVDKLIQEMVKNKEN